MRVAALYDVHGNLPALEAVLADVDDAGVDAILVGGDIASGPMPAETFGLLRSDRRLGDVRIINAGSVGVPYRRRCQAGARHRHGSVT